MTMEMTKLRKAILESGEEDYSGLWEAIELARSIYPSFDELRLRQIASREMLEMVRNGLLEIYRGTKFAGEQALADDAERALAHEDSWRGNAPTGSEHFRFAISPRGVAALRQI